MPGASGCLKILVSMDIGHDPLDEDAASVPASQLAYYRETAPRTPDGPLDVNQLVPGTGPINVDVGFGRGHSLFSRAEAAPEQRVLGFEVKTKWVCKVHERIQQEQRPRMAVFADDVRTVLPRLGADGSIAHVFVHFPDPWWKKRHNKRLVVTPTFAAEVCRLLEPGGTLFVQTDVPHRAEAYQRTLGAVQGLALETEQGGPFLSCSPLLSRSNRELRAEQDGLPVYRLLARKLGRR